MYTAMSMSMSIYAITFIHVLYLFLTVSCGVSVLEQKVQHMCDLLLKDRLID